MMIGPDPMMRIFFMSVRLGMKEIHHKNRAGLRSSRDLRQN